LFPVGIISIPWICVINIGLTGFSLYFTSNNSFPFIFRTENTYLFPVGIISIPWICVIKIGRDFLCELDWFHVFVVTHNSLTGFSVSNFLIPWWKFYVHLKNKNSKISGKKVKSTNPKDTVKSKLPLKLVNDNPSFWWHLLTRFSYTTKI